MGSDQLISAPEHVSVLFHDVGPGDVADGGHQYSLQRGP